MPQKEQVWRRIVHRSAPKRSFSIFLCFQETTVSLLETSPYICFLYFFYPVLHPVKVAAFQLLSCPFIERSSICFISYWFWLLRFSCLLTTALSTLLNNTERKPCKLKWSTALICGCSMPTRCLSTELELSVSQLDPFLYTSKKMQLHAACESIDIHSLCSSHL